MVISLLIGCLYYYFSNKTSERAKISKKSFKETTTSDEIVFSNGPATEEAHLSNSKYKIGIVYIWEGEETYNPNWRRDLFPNKNKIEKALNDIFRSQRKKFEVEFLGEFRARKLCWNPSKIAFILEFSLYPDSIEKGWYLSMPGSELIPSSENYSYLCFSKNDKILWSDCPPTRCEEFTHPNRPDDKCFRIPCENKYFTLATENQHWIKHLLNELEPKFNFSNYHFKVIVLGRAGPIIPQIGEREKHFFDNYMTSGEIIGYSTPEVIVMTENGLRIPSYYHRTGEVTFTKFFMPGWQQIVHEILHHFGAVDVYEPPLFEQNLYREEALKLEPESEVDKSIMANGWAGYCNKYISYYRCSAEDTEKIYLDKYNRIRLGLE